MVSNNQGATGKGKWIFFSRVLSFNLWAGALLALATGANAQTYDAIVVGSGPGGLVAAEFLSRDPTGSVLILEAGPKSLIATGGTDIPSYAQGIGLTKFDIPGEFDNTIYNAATRTSLKRSGRSRRHKWSQRWTRTSRSMPTQTNLRLMRNGTLKKDIQSCQKALLAKDYVERTINHAAARNSKSKTFRHAPYTFKKGKRDTPAAAFWGAMSSRSNVKLLTGSKVDYLLRAAGGKATGVSGIGPTSQLNILNGRSVFGGVSQAAGWVPNANVGRNLFDTNVVFASFSHPQMSSFQYKNKPSWAIDKYLNEGYSGPWASPGPTLTSYENYNVQGRAYEFQSTALTNGFGEFYSRGDAFTLSLYVNNPEGRAASGFDSSGNWKAFNEGNAYFGTSRVLA
ncbi:unnamed protein product [Phytophthora lilii]|uniref:Unnamed protein product n=1 Tax=Phytophthora lilii TaxID=2077276 RepID=A0A9W6YJH4_9STRA|nr:unnamed protein product [Phytophthora lilii]